MRTHALAAALVLAAVPGYASAVSTVYTLDLAGTSSGTFTVDPDLAAPVGPSAVSLIDFSITLETSAGSLTFGPADLTSSIIEARFIDGILAGLDGIGTPTAEVTTMSGSFGIAISLSTAANTAAEINPAMAGEGNFTIVSLPALTPVDDVCCSYGFAPAPVVHPVPEPTATLLFALGSLVVGVACARATSRA
jgi:hypothetical protein